MSDLFSREGDSSVEFGLQKRQGINDRFRDIPTVTLPWH